MSEKTVRDLHKTKKKSDVQMGAKIANQINSHQQTNMLLSAYCATTQSCTTVNINFA